MSESEILNISEKTGVSYRWLKHGEGRKYESETIATSDSGKIEKIKNASPKSLYFLLNESDMSILLIVHVESYNWRLFTFTFGLDFWDWFGDQHYIPEIFELLKCFRDEFGYTLQGRIIDSGLYERAISGNEHLSLIIEDTRGKGQHWFDDLLNINSSYFNQEYYSNLYGHWFAKIQRYFK